MWERYPPTPPFHCRENEIQASLISSASAGATPAPATNFREVIRLLDCKSGVIKYVSEATNWSITSTSHHFGLVAQPAERPVVCGRVEGATPFGSANFQILPRDSGSRCASRLLNEISPRCPSGRRGDQRVV